MKFKTLLPALALLALATSTLSAQDDSSSSSTTPTLPPTPQTPPAAESRSAADRAAAVPANSDKAKPSVLLTPAPAPLATDAEDGKIAQVVAQIMEKAHYLQKPLDDTMGKLFLKMYLDALDYRHIIFLQTDIDEFNAKYGVALGAQTLSGDVVPSRDIYNRYIQRLKERAAQVDVILKTPPDFSKNESFLADRSKAPWPQTLAEANELWRLQVKYELLAGLLSKEKPDKTTSEVSKRAGRLVKMMQEFDHSDVLGVYLSALTHAYDPHSDYFTADEAEDFRISSIDMSLDGIGAELGVVDGYPKIVNLVPGGPADLDGRLKPNDRIVAVSQEKGKPVDVVDMRLHKVVQMIRGKRGTKVILTVIPAEGGDTAMKKDIVITRNEVKLTDQKAKARLYEKQGADGSTTRYGVIILPTYYKDSADDVAKLIARLQKEKIQGLILDLRNNGGGILEEAINLVGLFVPRGPVVQVKTQAGAVKPFFISGNRLAYSGPMIVMDGRTSASASEITAAALQDYGRALVVGDQTTFGKGTVQTLISLKDINFNFKGDPGELKLTVQKFYRIAGGTTQHHGVSSDIVLPSLEDYYEYGESFLPNAMPADEVAPADYHRVNPPFPFLTALQDRSNTRVAKSPEFGYLGQQIDILRKKMADKTISLNLAQRQAELDTTKALKEKRDKELATLPPSDHKVYVLDLAMLDAGEPMKLVTKAVTPGKTTAAEKKANPGSALGSTDTEDGGEDESDLNGSSKEKDGVVRDIHLDETINIFADYISLLANPNAQLTAQAK